MSTQLRLPFLRSARLPFLVRRRAIGRTAQREMTAFAATLESLKAVDGFSLRSLIEDQALLVELRDRTRAAAREARRRSGARSMTAFACTLEGRRVHQFMDELRDRITQRQESLLCG